jgi:hypothetical protein
MGVPNKSTSKEKTSVISIFASPKHTKSQAPQKNRVEKYNMSFRNNIELSNASETFVATNISKQL